MVIGRRLKMVRQNPPPVVAYAGVCCPRMGLATLGVAPVEHSRPDLVPGTCIISVLFGGRGATCAGSLRRCVRPSLPAPGPLAPLMLSTRPTDMTPRHEIGPSVFDRGRAALRRAAFVPSAWCPSMGRPTKKSGRGCSAF